MIFIKWPKFWELKNRNSIEVYFPCSCQKILDFFVNWICYYSFCDFVNTIKISLATTIVIIILLLVLIYRSQINIRRNIAFGGWMNLMNRRTGAPLMFRFANYSLVRCCGFIFWSDTLKKEKYDHFASPPSLYMWHHAPLLLQERSLHIWWRQNSGRKLSWNRHKIFRRCYASVVSEITCSTWKKIWQVKKYWSQCKSRISIPLANWWSFIIQTPGREKFWKKELGMMGEIKRTLSILEALTRHSEFLWLTL